MQCHVYNCKAIGYLNLYKIVTHSIVQTSALTILSIIVARDSVFMHERTPSNDCNTATQNTHPCRNKGLANVAFCNNDKLTDLHIFNMNISQQCLQTSQYLSPVLYRFFYGDVQVTVCFLRSQILEKKMKNIVTKLSNNSNRTSSKNYCLRRITK